MFKISFIFVKMLAIFLLLMAAARNHEAAEVNCEKVDRFEKSEKCCYLDSTTIINEVNLTFGGLEIPDVDAILFEYNRKIQLLPVNVYKKFPNLEFYLARNAAIKEVSSANFERLSNLKVLNLRANQLYFIPNRCFEGLIKLSEIYLSKGTIRKVFAFVIYESFQEKTKSRQ